MKAAVITIDLAQANLDYKISIGYSETYILICWRGMPVGHIWLPVKEGKIVTDNLRTTLIYAAYHPFKSLTLKEKLGIKWNADMGTAKEKATVAICTRDRPDDVKRCLEGLKKMPDEGQEILVIDNCPSTDATAEVVASFPGVNYVVEKNPGLNCARNRAIKEAQHNIVAFVDDDAVPSSFWLRCLVNAFDDPLVLCITGLTVPLVLDTASQKWHEIYSPFGRGYEKKRFDTSWISPASSGHVGAGVNMALKKEAVELLGPFDEALDAGTITCSGGDSEMYARILSAGYRIVYTPGALSWHRHRETRKELRKAAFGYGVGVYAAWTSGIIHNREFGCIWVAWSWFKSQVKSLIKSLFRCPGSLPLDIVLAELFGCFHGPFRYFKSRRIVRKRIQEG